MSGQWVSIQPVDFLAKQPYSMEAHHWSSKRLLDHWDVCTNCGLVALRNDFTKWCIGKGCNYKDHPGYHGQRNKAGGHL